MNFPQYLKPALASLTTKQIFAHLSHQSSYKLLTDTIFKADQDCLDADIIEMLHLQPFSLYAFILFYNEGNFKSSLDCLKNCQHQVAQNQVS